MTALLTSRTDAGPCILPDSYRHPHFAWGITRGYPWGQFRPRSYNSKWSNYNGRY